MLMEVTCDTSDGETTLEWSCVKPWISLFLIKDSGMRWIGLLGEFPPQVRGISVLFHADDN